MLNKSRVALLWIERLLLAAGGILLAVFAAAHIDSWASSRVALQQFDRSQTGIESTALASEAQVRGKDGMDFSLWSQQRIQAFTQSLALLKEDRAVAVLGLDRLRIRVPVFDGTDDLSLNRGVGWIQGTARPGEPGNIGIAGHRDGFFRGLKDVQIGDLIQMQMSDKITIYRVSQTEIVNPEDVRVLRPTGQPSLTLVTCYPFYYIGSAPRRFIVHATLQQSNSVAQMK